MKYYIKQTVFSAVEHFTVKDEFGNDCFDVRSPRGFRVGLKLHVCDMAGNEIAFIDQKALSFQPTFRVHRDGALTATITKKFSLGKPRYEVKELGWSVQGDFLAHEYAIMQNGAVIMAISKEWFSWGDSFVLDIADETHLPEALAVVFAIDSVVDAEGNGLTVNGQNVGKIGDFFN